MQKKLPIFYNALLLTGVNLLLRFVATSFQVYLSGRIGASGIGLLHLVLSVGVLALTAGLAGVRTATMYLTAEQLGRKQPGNTPWILSACFLYSLLCSSAVCAALYTFAPWIAEHWLGDVQALGALRLYAAFLPVNCLCAVLTGYFTAANRIPSLAAVEIAEQVCTMAATIALLTCWAGNDVTKACQSVVLGNGIGCCLTLCTLWILRSKEKCVPGKRIPVAKPLLRTAVPLALADDLRAGISTTENLMVPKRLALYAGHTDPLAAFGTVCGMVFPVLMFPAAVLYALAELLIPELARCAAAKSHNRIRYLVKRSLRVAMLYGFIFSGLMFLLAEALCDALYRSTEAASFLRRFALLIPMLYCDAVTDAMTKGLGQQAACVRYNIITSVMDVALLFVLLPHFGMDGYFFSFLITHLLNFILSLRRLVKISHARLCARSLILTVCAAGAATWAAAHLSLPLPQAAGFLTLFACLLLLLGVVDAEDLRWLKGLVVKK